MIILSGDCTPFHLKYPKSYDACQQTNSMKKKKKDNRKTKKNQAEKPN